MKNPAIYIKRMASAMEEKLFFLNHLDLNDFDTIIDFGCADGELLRNIYGYCENDSKIAIPELIGIDFSESMLDTARKTSNSVISFVKGIKDLRKRAFKRVLIIFSSVWHEIYEENYDEIFNFMGSKSAIVIRDMIKPIEYDMEVQKSFLNISDFYFMVERYEDFRKEIETKEDLYEFFLKYSYVENWETEMLEKYFSTPWFEIDEFLKENFVIRFQRDYTLPFKQKKVYEDFGYVMHDRTHRQAIYVRK